MRGVLNVHVGHCGNGLGYSYWRRICEEHSITADGVFTGESPQQLSGVGTHFHDCDGRRFVPRSVFVDLDSSSLDHLRASDLGPLFRPDNFISSKVSCGNNWSIGHYTEGAEIVDRILNVIRKEAEACDRLHGFNYTFSLGGGTGSGLGTLIQSKVREEYPDRMSQSFNVFPSPNISHCVVEPYNAVLSIHHLVENQDLVHVFDNEALIAYQTHVHPNAGKSLQDLNQHVAAVMSDVSCGFRFPGDLNCDLRKLAVNLIPFPRLHFYVNNLFSKPSSPQVGPELVQTLFGPANTLCSVDTRLGKTLAAGVVARGAVSTFEVENSLQLFAQKNSSHFADWIPNNLNISMCKTPRTPQQVTATCVNGTTAIQAVFRHITQKFCQQFRRKAHLHWYTGQGMDEMEFIEAESNCSDLVSEYKQYQEAKGAYDEEE